VPQPTAPSQSFDRIYIATSLFFTGGLFLDGYAHNHLLSQIESFFTPWHAVFYAGFFAQVLLLGVVFRGGRRRGRSWREAVPPGYALSLLGAGIFFFGGFGDMIWHTLFGIEADVEALLSPTHLVLAFGGTLMGAGPLRSAWLRPGSRSPWTALLSAAITISAFTFMTQFAQPTYHPWAAASVVYEHAPDLSFILQSAGVAGLILQAAVFSGIALYLIQRWRLPFGAFTLVLGLNAFAMSFMHFEFRQIPAFLLAGLAVDTVYALWKPGPEDRGELQAFAFALPALITAAQFAALFLTDHVWWSVHMWAGSIALAGFVGLLMSQVAFPSPGGSVEG
jgi:hypothetical protein